MTGSPFGCFISASQTFRLRVSATCAPSTVAAGQHDDELSPPYRATKSPGRLTWLEINWATWRR